MKFSINKRLQIGVRSQFIDQKFTPDHFKLGYIVNMLIKSHINSFSNGVSIIYVALVPIVLLGSLKIWWPHLHGSTRTHCIGLFFSLHIVLGIIARACSAASGRSKPLLERAPRPLSARNHLSSRSSVLPRMHFRLSFDIAWNDFALDCVLIRAVLCATWQAPQGAICESI